MIVGFPGESPPDVQPMIFPNGYPLFGVGQQAFHGETYLAMVVRDNNTWEKIGQELAWPLKAGESYVWNIALCTSDQFRSASRSTGTND